MIANVLCLDEEAVKAFSDERNTQDLILGILLLKTKCDDLHHLSSLPIAFENIGFSCSRLATLFALGHNDLLLEEKMFPEELDASGIDELFTNWMKQPASEDIPEEPIFLASPKVSISSPVLGCNITAEVFNDANALFIAESIFAALEAFLSTSLDSTIFPHRSDFRLCVMPDQAVAELIDFELKENNGISFVEVQYLSDGFDGSELEHQDLFRDKIRELVITLVLEIAIIRDVDEFYEKLVKDEMGLARALNFTEVSTGVRNILGDNPKIRLSDWTSDEESTKFAVLRTSSWHSGQNHDSVEKGIKTNNLKPGKGSPPPEIRNSDGLKHNERRILSLIDMRLWDRAEWKGLGFGIEPSCNLPVLSFLFGDKEAGENVSLQVRQKLGREDI